MKLIFIITYLSRPVLVLNQSQYIQSYDYFSQTSCSLSIIFLNGSKNAGLLSHLESRRTFDFFLLVFPSKSHGEAFLEAHSKEVWEFKNMAAMSKISERESNCGNYLFYACYKYGKELVTVKNIWNHQKGKLQVGTRGFTIILKNITRIF